MVPFPLFRLGPSRDEVIEGWPWLDQVVLDGALIRIWSWSWSWRKR
jgi:hypothetical protein